MNLADLRSESKRIRFWEKVAITDGCWEWQASCDRKGYGQFMLAAGRLAKAHRMAWALANDQLPPDGQLVLHRCDNPPCCNPAHLFLGTASDNTADMMAKGRHRFVSHAGEQSGTAKVTDADIEEMRRLYKSGKASPKDLAARFGISAGYAWSVVTGRSRRRASPAPSAP